MKKTFFFTSILSFIAGMAMLITGSWGLYFTYQNVTKEKIITPDDASIPGVMVRGPFTLKSQADIIRTHMLRMSGGKTYAEMPRMVEQKDSEGNIITGEDGNPTMIPNETRNTWITAITLTNALNIAIIAYAFSALIAFLGLISIWTGINFYILCKSRS